MAACASLSEEDIERILHTFVYDTLSGVLSFVVPGSGCDLLAPGTDDHLDDVTTHNRVRALELALDGEPPYETERLRSMVRSLADALADAPLSILDESSASSAVALQDALGCVLDQGGISPAPATGELAAPLGPSHALLVSLQLNLLSTVVDPALARPDTLADGCTTTPFARLSFDDKRRVFELLEGPDPEILNVAAEGQPAAVQEALSSALPQLAQKLLYLGAFFTYSELAALDLTRLLTTGKAEIDFEHVPGWEASGYQEFERDGAIVYDTVHGWADFRGYYEDRTEAGDA